MATKSVTGTATKSAARPKTDGRHTKNTAVPRGKKHADASPFDLRVNKNKFAILNRQIVGSKGRPAQAKSRSQEVRKKSILPELARRGRAGDFIDRRFGERNPTLSTDDKMLERFSRERVRRSNKKSVFNLNEPDQNTKPTLTLTHKGRNVEDIDAFDSDLGDSDDDDNDNTQNGALDRDIVSSAHFGGPGSGGEAATRTKAEIMQEVIAKSKMHKYERQRINEQNAMLCDQLDADFDSIRHELDTGKKESAESLPLAKGETHDDYNEMIRQMSFERRVQPSDRTKSPEELAAKRSKDLDDERLHQKTRMESQDALEEHNDQDASLDTDADPRIETETDSERDLRRVMERLSQLIDEFVSAGSVSAANLAYVEIAALSRTNSVIPVARVIRTRLGEITESMTRSTEKGIAPVMPSRQTLLLLHLVGKIFSTSDYHHIVATPALLIMAAFMEHGRMLKQSHLLSSIFLMQTALSYQCESRRIIPELLYLLSALLKKAFGCDHAAGLGAAFAQPDDLTTFAGVVENADNTENVAIIATNSTVNTILTTPITADSNPTPNWCHYPATRFMSRTLDTLLTGPLGSIECRPVGFDDLLHVQQDEHSLTKEQIASHLVHLFYEAAQIYSASPAASEILSPLLALLRTHKEISPKITQIESGLLGRSRNREPLLLQKFKAVPIPQLTPELNDGPAREDRQRQRVARAYKREFKGAKRELKRDSAFLSQQKLQMRLEADQKYQERIRHIMGSISSTEKTRR